MNILVPHSWLKDYLQTELPPKELANLLSLHSFSTEKILAQEDGDFVYEVEITPNRGDALSIMGIAREFKAVLPAKGYPVSWKINSVSPKNPSVEEKDLKTLDVEIKDPTLVPRFCAVILDKVNVQASPRHIRDRLEKVGTRAINNVVDITNYLMFDWGQPMHAFDYDKISGAKMIVRESVEGEKMTTLDGVERVLPEGVIVIEDGSGRIIDLCGIMGAQNSEVDENTKRVLLFVQVYDPVRIRKASMALGHRTDAALRFEKGIDYQAVIPSLWYAVDLMEKYTEGVLSSKLIDIENSVYVQKKVYVDYEKISAIAGVDITPQEVKSTLTGLGFEFESGSDGKDLVLVPSWRAADIEIPEDLAEEVIRILGYSSLPNKLPTGEIPLTTLDPVFYWEDLAKNFLKYQGFFECYTASATSKELAGENALGLKNPLNEDFFYFRKSLIPQLLTVLNSNKGYADELKLFELARVYDLTTENKKEGQLPEQPFMLALVTKGVDFLVLKGVVEALLAEMGIKDLQFAISAHERGILSVEIPFGLLVSKATKLHEYVSLVKYNSIKEDLTTKIDRDSSFEKIVDSIKKIDSRIVSVEFSDIYEDKLTLSLEFLDREKQITSEDVAPIREKILKIAK